MQKIRHMIGSLFRRLWAPALRWSYKRFSIGYHAGICIVDISLAKYATNDFFRRTQQALDLIAKVDPKRFQRVQRELEFIVHSELAFAAASYTRRPPTCKIDFTRRDFGKKPKTELWIYAALIVHEATHGEIYRRGVPYSKANKLRIERLCDVEAARFLRRIDPHVGSIWEEKMTRSPAEQVRSRRRPWWQRGAEMKIRRKATSMANEIASKANRRVHSER